MSHDNLPPVTCSPAYCHVTSPPAKRMPASRSPLVAGAEYRSPRQPLSAATRNSRRHEMVHGAWLPEWELDSGGFPAAAAAPGERADRRYGGKRPNSEVSDAGRAEGPAGNHAERESMSAADGSRKVGNYEAREMDEPVSPACVLATAARDALAMAAADGCSGDDDLHGASSVGLAGEESAGDAAVAEGFGAGVAESTGKIAVADACVSPSLPAPAEVPVPSRVEAELDQRQAALGGLLAALQQRMSALRALAGGGGNGEGGVVVLGDASGVVDGQEEQLLAEEVEEEDGTEDGVGVVDEERREGEVNDVCCDREAEVLQRASEGVCRETGAAAGSVGSTESSASGSVRSEGHGDSASSVDSEHGTSSKDQDEQRSKSGAANCTPDSPGASISGVERMGGVRHGEVKDVSFVGKEAVVGEEVGARYRQLELPCVLSDDSDDDHFYDLPTSPSSLLSGPSSPHWLLHLQSASSSASSPAAAATEPVLEADRLGIQALPLSQHPALPLQLFLWVISCCSRRLW
ncbi:hypothetical protein CLOM_g1686 [Closterium sp. NIES-68]|nr:hypothetical protein CLOM_g1686 [Closterium sp. NIES-68]GJP78852.1 hypothetical protein CLOP_g9117 [Closterium sp. NIES-67]